MLYGSWSEEARNYLRDTKSFSARNLFLQTNESGSYDCTQENGSTIRGTGTEHEETPVRYKYDVRRNKYVEELNYGTQSFELFSGAESRSEWYWFPKIFSNLVCTAKYEFQTEMRPILWTTRAHFLSRFPSSTNPISARFPRLASVSVFRRALCFR